MGPAPLLSPFTTRTTRSPKGISGRKMVTTEITDTTIRVWKDSELVHDVQHTLDTPDDRAALAHELTEGVLEGEV